MILKPLLSVVLLLTPFLSHQAVAAKPNIVLILADDLGYGSLGCYGNAEVKTPNIDALAAGGIRFTDYHSNGSLCSPTRAALMTGRYQQRCINVPDEDLTPTFREQRKANPDQRWAWGISEKELMMPAVFKKAGYRTALVGKWHLGYDLMFHPMNYGFDKFRGFIGGNVDNHTHVAGYGTKELDWWNGRKIENEPGYSTDLLTRYAVDFIVKNKDAPFFLYLAHGAVHTPLQGRDAAKKKTRVELYREVIGTLDDSVGAVVGELKKNGLEKNTLVVFCSDNGPAAPSGFSANGGLSGKKNSLLEGGHRVPFIASWPETIPAGTTSDSTVIGMDLLPTFAALTGAALPADCVMDGVDTTSVFKGRPLDLKRDLHWQSGETWAVRRGNWKLMGNGPLPKTLVNLSDDLAEKKNLIEDKPELVDDLLKQHAKWLAGVGE